MVLGVEYRTTERYGGYPVYIKRINMGKGPVSGTTTKFMMHTGNNPEMTALLGAEVYAQGFSMGTEGFIMNDYILTLPYQTEAAELAVSVGYITGDYSVSVYSIKGDLSFATCYATVRYLKEGDVWL